MDKDQLAALRRQVEEDYKLDMAAIERLERRFLGASSPVPSNAAVGNAASGSYSVPTDWSSFQAQIEPASADRQSEELVGSRRTVFAASRK